MERNLDWVKSVIERKRFRTHRELVLNKEKMRKRGEMHTKEYDELVQLVNDVEELQQEQVRYYARIPPDGTLCGPYTSVEGVNESVKRRGISQTIVIQKRLNREQKKKAWAAAYRERKRLLT